MVRRKATIYDVAREAGVATSTVSRAFTRPGRLNERTVAKVLAAATLLDYSPNRAARVLSTGRTKNLATLVPSIVNPFFAEFTRSFNARANDRGYAVYLIDTGENSNQEVAWIERVSPQVDGLALVAPRMSTSELMAATEEGEFVVVNRQIPGRSCIWTDSAPALREAFADLVDFGHRRLIYLRGPVGGNSDAIRRRRVRAIVEELGLELHVTSPQRDESIAALHALELVDRVGATAVIAHNDVAAIALIAQCRKRGLEVPADLSVLGHDDIPFASIVHPSLTTIATQTELIGQRSADALIDTIERRDEEQADKQKLQLSFDSTYVRRESIGASVR